MVAAAALAMRAAGRDQSGDCVDGLALHGLLAPAFPDIVSFALCQTTGARVAPGEDGPAIAVSIP
jgi:hypothetical protein